MKLLTKANAKALPPLYSQDGKGEDAVAQVKFFTPTSNWTWYATEANAIVGGEEVPLNTVTNLSAVEDVTFFGKVVGFETELGYFSLNELAKAKGPFGLGVERDMHFKPTPLKECA